MTDTIDNVNIKVTTEGGPQAVDQLNKVAGAMGGVVGQSQQTERSTTSMEGKFAALERRLGTSEAKWQSFGKEVGKANAFLEQNPQDVDRVNAVLDKLEQKFGFVSQAMQKQRQEAEKLAAVQSTIDQSTGVTGLGGQHDIDAYGKSLDDLRAKYNPLFAAGQQYKSTLSDINFAAKVGALTEAEAAAAIARTKTAFVEKVAVLRGVTTETIAAAHAEEALSLQGQSAFHATRGWIEQVASGVPLLQATTQQINHLTFAASGQGGLSGAFGEVANLGGRAVSAIAGMISPLNVSIAGVGVLTVALGALALQYDKVQRASQQALTGAGARTGTTVSDLNKFVDTNATSGLTQHEARTLADDLTKTGDIVVGKLHGMGEAVTGFAHQTDLSMADAEKAFVKFAQDPQKALDELSKTFGAFDSETKNAVDDLIVAGDKTAAFQKIIDAMSPSAKKAADNLNILQQAWRGVVSFLGSETAKPTGPEQQLESLKKQLDASRADVAGGDNSAVPYIDYLTSEIEKLQKTIDQINTKNATAQLNDLKDKAEGVVYAIIPEIKTIQTLQEEIGKLQRLQAAGGATREGADADNAALTALRNRLQLTQQLQQEHEREQAVVASVAAEYSNVGQAVAMTLKAQQNTLPVAQAIGGAQKMAAQYAADFADAMLKGKTAEEATALAAVNLEHAQAQANASAKETLFNLQNQAQVAAAVTGQEQMFAQATAEANRLIHDGVDAQIAQQVAAQQLANAQAQATANVEKQVESLKDSTRMIYAQQNGTEATTAAAIAYKNAIESGADATAAAALKAATLANYMAQAAVNAQNYAGSLEIAGQATTFNTLGVPYAPDYSSSNPGFTASFEGGSFEGGGFNGSSGGGGSAGGGAYTASPLLLTLAGLYGGSNYFELANQQNQQKSQQALTSSIDKLTTATNSNTTSLNTLNASLPPVLSSLYRQGHVAGFGFAEGGIMTAAGPAMLRAYGDGGVVDRPQMFITGERYQPEAIIPLRGGAVPVQITGSGGNRGGGNISINAPIIINANNAPGMMQAAAQAAQDFRAIIEGYARR